MTLYLMLIASLLYGARLEDSETPEAAPSEVRQAAEADDSPAPESEPKSESESKTESEAEEAEETPKGVEEETPKNESKEQEAKPAPSPSMESLERRPTLRLRRPKPDEAKESNLDPIKRTKPDEAPDVPARNIPAPDEMNEPPTELDKELLGELGQDLEAAQEEEDPLLRAGRRMREVEEKLAQLEATDPTIELQDKILADLDELLKQRQSGKPPPQNQNQNQKQKKNDQQQMAQQQQRQQGAQQRQDQSRDAAEKAGPARSGREEFGTPKEVKDVWGHLSELMREEMSQYAKEGFLEKYREMLEQYYSTIATRSSGSE